MDINELAKRTLSDLLHEIFGMLDQLTFLQSISDNDNRKLILRSLNYTYENRAFYRALLDGNKTNHCHPRAERTSDSDS